MSRIFPQNQPVPAGSRSGIRHASHLDVAVSANDSRPEVDRKSIGTIAICTVGELFGGVERHVLGLLGGLRDAGVGALLILFHDGEVAAQAREQGYDLIILPNENRSLFATARSLGLVISERGVRLVHAHGYKAGVFCAVARLSHRFELVKTEHGLPEPLLGNVMMGVRDRAYRVIEAIATQAVRASVCYVTKELQAYHRSAHRGLQTVVIPNGVPLMDPHDFARPDEYSDIHLNLAIVGRLDPVKGHEFAIDALSTEPTIHDIDLYIVGSGPAESRLREFVSSRKLDQQVHFLGFRRNVYDFIAHCDALLMPSVHEGLPYTLLEAMALGRPIIASRVGGLAETLEDGCTALLPAPGDVKAIATAIRRIGEDQSLRKMLGENARAVQRDRYSQEVMTLSYLQMFQAHLAARQ